MSEKLFQKTRQRQRGKRDPLISLFPKTSTDYLFFIFLKFLFQYAIHQLKIQDIKKLKSCFKTEFVLLRIVINVITTFYLQKQNLNSHHQRR